MTTLSEVAAEAVNSALFNLPFARFLGEVEDPANGNDVAWFRLYEDPEVEELVTREQRVHTVLVSTRLDVIGEADVVVVAAQWLNVHGGTGTPLRCGQSWTISCDEIGMAYSKQATEEVVEKILNIYRDVLTGEGVAGDISLLAPESEASDPDDPEDMAVPE